MIQDAVGQAGGPRPTTYSITFSVSWWLLARVWQFLRLENRLFRRDRFSFTANKLRRSFRSRSEALTKDIPSDPSRHGRFLEPEEIPKQVVWPTINLNQEKTMKLRLLLTVAGLISFAVPALIAQDAMKVVTADEVVWKDDTLFKGAQIANLLGDPAKAETVVMRVKWPPNFKVPLHTHPVTEVLTVLSGTLVDSMGDETKKGVTLKPGSLLVLPANHTHSIWTTDEETIFQLSFTGPFDITFVNPADDPRKKAQ
jgi:quercetin dioxygenase-like cupin family protein